MNKAGEKQAVIDISSHKYRDYVAGKVNFIQTPESAVSTLPDGSKVDVRMTYDYPMRHEDTYFGTLGLDAEGNWVMRQKCFPGDKVLATVPVVTPHGVGSTEVDITRYYYQTLYPVNPKFIELLQKLGRL